MPAGQRVERRRDLIGITLLSVAILAPLVIVTAFFALEVLVGLRPLRSAACGEAGGASAVIVIPAHDEEAVIEGTIRAALAEADGEIGLLVVADNCADGTADLARSAGARVLVRDDPDHRGKGFALAAAREHLRSDPPDVVIVLDADCRIDDQSLRALVGCVVRTGRPCQAINLLAADLKVGPLVQI